MHRLLHLYTIQSGIGFTKIVSIHTLGLPINGMDHRTIHGKQEKMVYNRALCKKSILDNSLVHWCTGFHKDYLNSF